MLRKLNYPAAAAALAALAFGLHRWRRPAPENQEASPDMEVYAVPTGNVSMFPGLHGPDGRTTPIKREKTSPERYRAGGPGRLAVLLNTPDSRWLGLVHALKSFGIPFRLVSDVKEALSHDVVLLYAGSSPLRFSPGELKDLADFPRRGGTLIGVGLRDGILGETFGFKEAFVSAKRRLFSITSAASPLTAGFAYAEEKAVSLGDPRGVLDPIATVAFSQPVNPPLMTADDGSAFLIRRDWGRGRAFALGVDLGFLADESYNLAQDFNAERTYVNAYEPSLDVLVRIVRTIYSTFARAPVLLGTVPWNKALTVAFTHDIDYEKALYNAVDYAEYEKSAGLRATYFLQTKYIKDWADVGFYNPDNMKYVRRVDELGMELASHSVSHSALFSSFPLGMGNEQYPRYQPFVQEFKVAYNGSVLGELRVSKFLLESQVEGLKVVSFRAGHLKYPRALPEMLQAAGYKYDSSVTGNNALTNLPYRLQYHRGGDQETDVYEFPISVEDEAPPPMLQRLPQALELAGKLSSYGGFMAVLIHPNEVGDKLKFEQGLTTALKDKAWFTTIEKFGDWWSARDAVDVDAAEAPGGASVTVAPARAVEGLTLLVPDGWRYIPARGLRAAQAGSAVVIDRLEGTATLRFSAKR